MLTSGAARFAALHARVRVLYSHLLTPQEMNILSEVTDFNTLVEFLQDLSYGPYLQSAEENELTPRRAEFQITGRLADVCQTVLQSSPERAQHVLRQYYRHYEVDNLKAVLRGIVSGAPWERVLYVLFPLGSYSNLPAQAMVETKNVAAAIEMLHDTPYYDSLSHAMERYEAEKSLFPLEVALDLNYWHKLWYEVNRLTNQDRDEARRVVGPLLDSNNLIWAIRYRVYHHLSEEEIINYTLPFGYHVRDEDIRSIAAGADIPLIVKRIYPDLPNLDQTLQDPRKGLPGLEKQLQRRVVEKCRSAFIGYPFHIGVPLAFLVLIEMEIRDLTVLIEAKSSERPYEGYPSYLLMGSISE